MAFSAFSKVGGFQWLSIILECADHEKRKRTVGSPKNASPGIEAGSARLGFAVQSNWIPPGRAIAGLKPVWVIDSSDRSFLGL
jgi:hypothetical protein